MSRLAIMWSVFAVTLVVAVVFLVAPPVLAPTSHSKAVGTRLRVGQSVIWAEVASTEAERAQGLSGRVGLPDGQGMLFVFPEPGRYEFWMKEMRFPLDFLWIRQGVVVQLNTDIPAPSPSKPNPARLSPQQEVDKVLEVPAGWLREHGITLGAKVEGL